MRTFINLLPFAYRRKELLRRHMVQWCLVWALCGMVLMAICGMKQSRCRKSQQVLNVAKSGYSPVVVLIHERDSMRTELDRLHAKDTLLGQLRDERPLLTLIGLASRIASECDGRLVVHTMSFVRRNSAPDESERQPDESEEETERPWASVTFQGNALDNLAVATFVVGLRDTGLFRRVELKSSVGDKSTEARVRSFALECDI